MGITKLPAPADTKIKARTDLPASPALSIVENGPKRFEGRKLGILITDGSDAALLTALRSAIEEAGGTVELIAPKVGGVTTSDGKLTAADEMINGAPSVLYDAVALLPSEAGVADLLNAPAAQDFVTDAYAHCKFIGFTKPAKALFDKVGLSDAIDDGFAELSAGKKVSAFVGLLGELRLWAREDKLNT